MEVRQRKGQASNGGTKDGDMASSKGPQPQSPPPPPKSKLQTLMIRSVVGIIMILSFLLILWSGHAVVCLFVFALQVVAFREFINLRYRQEKEKKLATFRTLHWYGSQFPFVAIIAFFFHFFLFVC
jgi:predicted CDP-diglyceride synthetase/phosphatidate cytidylyltransferase